MENNILTNKDYTCTKRFNAEMAHIFSNCWTFCGLVEDLQENNRYLTVVAGLASLVVLRDEQGELKAFHNFCRHRGMKLLDGQGRLSAKITCPYHDWTYDQSGKLKSLPKAKQEFEGLNKACLSLKRASVGIWRGMVWVHPDPNAVPVQQYFSGMGSHVAPYDVEALVEAKEALYEVTINANWKLVAENYIDHYHLAQLHAGTLHMYDHKKAEFGFVDEHVVFWEPLAQAYYENIDQHSPYPLLIDKNDKKMGAWVPLLFPNVGLAESESSWSVFHIMPLSVDQTKVVVRCKVKNCSSMTFIKQAAKSYTFWTSRVKAKSSQYEQSHALGSGDFMQEDIFVCEQLQQSLSNPWFEFGPSAKGGERLIRGFQQRVNAKLTQGGFNVR